MGTDRSAYGSGRKTRAQDRDNRRSARREAQASRPQFDLFVIDCEGLLKCLEQVALCDGALRIGLSRDKGALAIGVYGDGEPYTDYVGAGEDVNEYFRKLGEYFTEQYGS